MAVTHETTTRNTVANAVVDLLDAGGAGTLEFRTSGDVEVATLALSATAFGAASAGTATAATISDDTSATGNVSPVAKFVLKNGSGTVILTGSAGDVGTEDIVLSSAVIGATDTVSCSSLTYSAPA